MARKENKIIPIEKLLPDFNKTHYRNSNPNTIQHPSRVLICGPSGCGKTTVVLNLLLTPHLKMDWDFIEIYAKHIDEPAYQALIQRVNEIESELSKQEKKEIKLISFDDSLKNLPPLEERDKSLQTVIIVDDMFDTKNRDLIEYFIASRKFNCTVFFLTQRLSKTDRTIRNNCNVAMFFKPTPRESSIIFQDYGGPLDKKTWKAMTESVYKVPKGFLTIYSDEPLEKMYRNGMGEFINTEKIEEKLKDKKYKKQRK